MLFERRPFAICGSAPGSCSNNEIPNLTASVLFSVAVLFTAAVPARTVQCSTPVLNIFTENTIRNGINSISSACINWYT